jgi:hypothetical protein
MSFILNRFKTFEFYRNDLLNVFDLWDRTKGITRNPPTPTNQLEEDHLSNALAGGAGAKKQAQKKDKSNFQKNILINLNLIFSDKKTDVKDKEKVERTDDSGPASTPNQQQQLSSATPTNFVQKQTFHFLIKSIFVS